MSDAACPFCDLSITRVFHADELVLATWDAFPVSEGHALVVPKRHVARWADTTDEEQRAITAAIRVVQETIDRRYRPAGFNLGVNDGAAAGQTIPHLHLHVIPRYRGDVRDPRGGVRYVIPGRARYWESAKTRDDAPNVESLISGGAEPLLPHLLSALDRADHVQVAVAFVMTSGVAQLEAHLEDLLTAPRNGTLELLTGDYMGVTDPEALQRLLGLRERVGAGERFRLRVYETDSGSFHPKAYVFHRDSTPQVAFVGSSNLTQTALSDGIEWSYRVIPENDRSGLDEIARKFERLWDDPRARDVTPEWVESYRERHELTRPASGVPAEPPAPPPTPHTIQREALAALERSRREGHTAGLVVLATGLGKTWLSAFDCDRPEYRRVLFVAHREEILSQAMATFARIRPRARLGRYTGHAKDRHADVLFASVQTLGRTRHLERFETKAFDYIVVDEFHHAAAKTYRRLLDHFEPKFLLGLTATPERTDGGDLLGLCQENLVFRCDVGDGIERELLCPFHYFGVPDEVDYSNIPWRNRRFDTEALTQAVATQDRARNALEQYRERGGSRTLAFCCSMRHADFMADYFDRNGVRAVAVHSGHDSAPRASSLERLEAGELDVVCAVDMFNEGVDVPNIDTVLMLRPTESRILWLQQFGRGLRRAEGKSHLTVIDYIGNHRAFLIKPRTLFGLGSGDHEIQAALERVRTEDADLPPGCEVTYDLEAMDILEGLLRVGKSDEALERFYADFKDRQEIRPTASECFREGYSPRAARKSQGSWLEFVRSRGDFDSSQEAAFEQAGAFLVALETTPMTRSYKMLVLLAMLNRDALPGRLSIRNLIEEFARIARRTDLLRAELAATLDDPEALRRLIEKNPIEAWTGGKGTRGRPFFEYSADEFRCVASVQPEARAGLRGLVREIAEWRLAEYLQRGTLASSECRFTCRVSRSGDRPILFLPDREKTSGLPTGTTPVEADGRAYEADFVKVAVNVLRPAGGDRNVLPELLYGWFGDRAGQPGTRYHVLFERRENGYIATPVRDVPQPGDRTPRKS